MQSLIHCQPAVTMWLSSQGLLALLIELKGTFQPSRAFLTYLAWLVCLFSLFNLALLCYFDIMTSRKSDFLLYSQPLATEISEMHGNEHNEAAARYEMCIKIQTRLYCLQLGAIQQRESRPWLWKINTYTTFWHQRSTDHHSKGFSILTPGYPCGVLTKSLLLNKVPNYRQVDKTTR